MYLSSTKIKTIGKKTIYYSLLLTIKESYLFSRNLLGLIFHPFKTLRAIEREKDYSQAFLLFGLPFYILILGTIIMITARLLFIELTNPREVLWKSGALPRVALAKWGILMKSSLFLIFAISFFIFIYLLYWIYKVRKVK
jgi:hypothetical protein